MSDIRKVIVSSVTPLLASLNRHLDTEYLFIHCTVSFWKTITEGELFVLQDALRNHPSLKIVVFGGNSWASLKQVGIVIDFLKECQCPIRAVMFRVIDPCTLEMDPRERGALINKILFRAFVCPTIQKITFTTGNTEEKPSMWIEKMNERLDRMLVRRRMSSKY